METRLDHPEVLTDFEAVAARRVRRWVWFCMGLWLLLLTGDWVTRFTVFHWQDRWRPGKMIGDFGPVDKPMASQIHIPEQMGGGLTQMVPVPWMVERYAEFHPAYTEFRDAWRYANEPQPQGTVYPVLMLGDSFMLSLGTQNLAQVLAEVGGINVYNHASRGAGPFLEIRRFIGSDQFSQMPQVVIWNLTARELGAPLFSRQDVDYWFDQAGTASFEMGKPRAGIRWDLLAPSELRKTWPNTSLTAYFSRRAWAQIKLLVFRGWPQDVLGADDPEFGPMLFYRENLRVLPLMTAQTDAPVIINKVLEVARRFRERGISLALLAAIETGLEEGGVPVVNMMPRFQKATEQGVRLYWRDDTHWNDAGIRLAAEELWRVTEPLLQ